MLLDFCTALRAAKLPVSPKEYLTLLDAVRRDVTTPSIDDFYVLSRCTLVKDEALFDKFDRAFAAYFRGVDQVADLSQDVQFDWLRRLFERELSAEQKAQFDGMSWANLMAMLKQALKAQKADRNADGSSAVEAAASSQANANSNPGIAQVRRKEAGNGSLGAWDERHFKDYDDSVELGTRNLKIALRRLRRFAREGAEEELDLDGTIRATASNAGCLDIRMVPRRHNRVKVLLLMDVGGTMDEHIERVQELFSAAKSEFKRLEFFYFHNCVYDSVWKNNKRRHSETSSTWDLIRTYDKDHMLMLVGDATMSASEILQTGGGVEYNNKESGVEWLQRLLQAFPRHVWINPEPEHVWAHRQTIGIVRKLMNQHMVPLTVQGLEAAMKLLSK